MEEVGPPSPTKEGPGDTLVVPRPGTLPPDVSVEDLQKELQFYKNENERKEKELAEITQVCRAVMEKLHVLTCHINDKEKEDEVER